MCVWGRGRRPNLRGNNSANIHGVGPLLEADSLYASEYINKIWDSNSHSLYTILFMYMKVKHCHMFPKKKIPLLHKQINTSW